MGIVAFGVYMLLAPMDTSAGEEAKIGRAVSPAVSVEYSHYQNESQRCGETIQARKPKPPPHKVTKLVRRRLVKTMWYPTPGMTYCGYAVSLMVQCLAQTRGIDCPMNEPCGDGKDFVKCESKFMDKCGYKKVVPSSSPLCAKAGAVFAYNLTPTLNGSRNGHVEFVCGDKKYCSVYAKPGDKQWPWESADGCWYPKEVKEGEFDALSP
jgi:hypothetical protein